MSRNRMIQSLFLVMLLGTVILGGIILLKKPRHDREWSPALARITHVDTVSAFQYQFNNVRAWEYAAPSEAIRKEWLTVDVNAEHLEEIWFFIEPFGSNPVFAHSFLSFVFKDDTGKQTTLSISVEARKEAGEAYSAVLGALRAFELSYIWSTEKDVLSRIAVKLDHSVYAYKLDLDIDQAMMIFDYFVKRTNELAAGPRFYNTLHSNCTNELAKVVNQAFPGALPWHKSWVLTGRSAKWLHDLGFVGREGESFTTLKQRSDIQHLIKNRVKADNFDRQWREDLLQL